MHLVLVEEVAGGAAAPPALPHDVGGHVRVVPALGHPGAAELVPGFPRDVQCQPLPVTPVLVPHGVAAGYGRDVAQELVAVIEAEVPARELHREAHAAALRLRDHHDELPGRLVELLRRPENLGPVHEGLPLHAQAAGVGRPWQVLGGSGGWLRAWHEPPPSRRTRGGAPRERRSGRVVVAKLDAQEATEAEAEKRDRRKA
mmetsp:Transcript_20497/g.57657  ORF Transcript_20497/g.57657 Transcript_20497/m.57657 type:complete len:201 (+) Transcript_20497:339-941(+)